MHNYRLCVRACVPKESDTGGIERVCCFSGLSNVFNSLVENRHRQVEPAEAEKGRYGTNGPLLLVFNSSALTYCLQLLDSHGLVYVHRVSV